MRGCTMFIEISLQTQQKEDGRMHFEEWLLVSSVLLLLSILAWKVSNRLGIPALLLFLGIGMLAGSDGPGGIYFDNALVAQSVGVIALSFILFAGGLDTEWRKNSLSHGSDFEGPLRLCSPPFRFSRASRM